MPTLTAYSTSADGTVNSQNATWLTMRAGASLNADAGNLKDWAGIDNVADNESQQLFLDFNTSTVGAANAVSLVTLSLWAQGTAYSGTWTMEARAHDWSATLDTGDWVPGADWTTKTLCASKAGFTDDAYNAFTSTANFPAAVNRTGTTRLVLCSENIAATSRPGADQLENFIMAETSGTTSDPKLYLEYAPASTATFFGCNF